MPYFLRKQDSKTCVVKGTKEDPGEVVKCHSTRKKALAHMAALYVHVEDAAKEEDTHTLQKTSETDQYKDAIIGILRLYKEEKNGNWQDRWIAVSTVQMWDRRGRCSLRQRWITMRTEPIKLKNSPNCGCFMCAVSSWVCVIPCSE